MTIEESRDLLAMIEVKEPNELIVNSWWGSFVKDYKEALHTAIKSLEADRAIEKTLYAIREEMQFIKVAELQIYGANSWRFSNAIEDIIDKHLSEVSE